MSDPAAPSWRKPAGALAICVLIAVWAVLVVSLSGAVGGWWWPLQLVFYVVTGIVWITPLKPLLRWMELGRGGRKLHAAPPPSPTKAGAQVQ